MLTRISTVRCFEGQQLQVSHPSAACDCTMTLSVYLPPQADNGPVPVLWWLSGLTCTDQNFVTKAGAQRYAAEHGIALVAPDTSPRGPEVPGDPDGAWDFGHGASFYVDATQQPWARHYQMHRYILDELPAVLAELPLDLDRQSISGHSMGGHGALVLALRNPGRYRSVSAFAPIVAPSLVPWGQKALGRLLGAPEVWAGWDACRLVEQASERLLLRIDQGTADPFLDAQLQPWRLKEAAGKAGHPIDLRMREGYDHSYHFVSTFIGEHIAAHAEALHTG